MEVAARPSLGGSPFSRWLAAPRGASRRDGRALALTWRGQRGPIASRSPGAARIAVSRASLVRRVEGPRRPRRVGPPAAAGGMGTPPVSQRRGLCGNGPGNDESRARTPALASRTRPPCSTEPTSSVGWASCPSAGPAAPWGRPPLTPRPPRGRRRSRGDRRAKLAPRRQGCAAAARRSRTTTSRPVNMAPCNTLRPLCQGRASPCTDERPVRGYDDWAATIRVRLCDYDWPHLGGGRG